MFLDGKNVLLGGEYPFTGTNAAAIEARNNAAVGYLALSALKSGKK